MISISVTEKETGCRLDRVVRKSLPLMSLSGIYALIRKGGVRVSGRRVRQDYRLQGGDLLEIAVDGSERAEPQTDTRGEVARLVNTVFFKRNFKVLYEDRDFLACNKPAGLVVHPGTGHLRYDTLIDLAEAYLRAGGKITSRDEIAPAHRLDRDTSGVIVIAKNKPALRRIHEAIRKGAIVKHYTAICHSRPPENEGEIAVKLVRGRDGRGETTMHVAGPGERGDFSRSRYRVAAFEHGLSRLEVLLDTGKTHQIRIHCAHAGAPIVGDTRYGDAVLDKALYGRRTGMAQRLYLHAQKFVAPAMNGGKKLSVTAPLPDEFNAIMKEGV
jgi:23S rRNA pseudouridine955/2504/2580 synthase